MSKPQTPLASNATVVVLQEYDSFENDGIKIGSIQTGDNGLSVNCSYEEMMNTLKTIAKKNGGNLIKITKHKLPDLTSTCDRISAEIYRVPNFRLHEKTILWEKSRKLVWEDFKGVPNEKADSLGAVTFCGFGYRSNYLTLLTKVKLNVNTTFYCNKSWVKENQKNREDLLAHEQLHFDIAELYARRLRKRFSSVKIKPTKSKEIVNTIFSQVYAQYNSRQQAYDDETDRGLKKEEQNSWRKSISQELEDLKAYEK